MTRVVATLRAVSYWYPGSAQPSLRDVTLAIEPGLTVVAGASGGGKSTLLRALDGLVPQFHGGRIAGTAIVAGLDPFRTPIRALAGRVGLVFQDPETQAVYDSVEREVAFGLENAGLPRAEMHDRVDEALSSLGIETLRERRLETLSSGERQRVQLAAVLAVRPELIALDEPTSQLDPDGAAAIVDACLRLAADGGTVVVAEHRLDRLLPAADTLVLMTDGAAEASSRPRELAPRLATTPPIVELGLALGWRPPALSVEEARGRRPELRLLPGASAPDGIQGFAPAVSGVGPTTGGRSPSGTAAWRLQDVAASPGRGVPPVLEGLEVAGRPGEVVALVGPNGAGKTTFLRTLAGLVPAVRGTVDRAPGRVAYLPQNPAALLHLPTVREEVVMTLAHAASTERPEAILGALGLLPLSGRYPRDLSAGERQRVALAAILAGSPRLALLDEPTRGMDLAARRRLRDAIRALAGRGTSVVLATHDPDLAAEAADRVVALRDGMAVDLGPPEIALAAGSPFATQIARLFPDGPVTVEGALAALASGTGAAAAEPDGGAVPAGAGGPGLGAGGLR